MDTAKTGAYLASLRKAAGMTQQDAADRLGVSNKTVSKWESGVSHAIILQLFRWKGDRTWPICVWAIC